MDEKEPQEQTPLEKPPSVQPLPENELSDADLEKVVGGVSIEAALDSFQSLTGNTNQGGT